MSFPGQYYPNGTGMSSGQGQNFNLPVNGTPGFNTGGFGTAQYRGNSMLPSQGFPGYGGAGNGSGAAFPTMEPRFNYPAYGGGGNGGFNGGF